MRVALVHDWLLTRGGAERVLEAIWRLYPEADLYTVLADPAALPEQARGRRVRETWIRSLPRANRWYQRYLPFMTCAIEDLDLSAYDLVLSDSSAVSKGVLTRTGTVHVSYIHSPMRYAWDLYHEYRRHEASPTERRVMSPVFSYVRQWDYLAAQRPDVLLANSSTVQQRIEKHYRRSSQVIFPPVDVDRFAGPFSDAGPYWLVLSRLVSYKRFDLAVEACNRLRMPLVIAGDGPERVRLQRLAGPTVRFTGPVSDVEAARLLTESRGLLFPGEEDFGIVLVEAQAAGRPVVAYGRGGALDTVVDGETGVLFREQTADGLVDAMRRTMNGSWDPARLRSNAERFSARRFDHEYSHAVQRALVNAGRAGP
ncbi:MAG: glycosyltransferase [Clostridia bacterium]